MTEALASAVNHVSMGLIDPMVVSSPESLDEGSLGILRQFSRILDSCVTSRDDFKLC